jgi:hypothetical protein
MLASSPLQAYTGTYPYPKWFFSPRDSSTGHALFRLYGYEGSARNLFVLSCNRSPRVSATVELIPPFALEEPLRQTASASARKTTVTISDHSTGSRSENTVLFQTPGEYDKISAFIEITSEKSLFEFLQLLRHEELLVKWDQTEMEYLLIQNETTNSLFIANFRAKLKEKKYEEVSYQDVFVHCSKLWTPASYN